MGASTHGRVLFERFYRSFRSILRRVANNDGGNVKEQAQGR
jgi:hypothetical protein